jgi:GNAT superfamily N-acetyltransferase
VPIVAYEPRRHGAFVYTAFARGSGEPPETLDALIDNDARIAVLEGPSDRDLFIGFAITTGDQQVAWAYVKPLARRQGLAKALVQHLGVNLDRPVTALFPAPAVKQLRRRGYQITLQEAE